MRSAFSAHIKFHLSNDPNVILLLGDIGVGAFEGELQKTPKQVHNVGILEQSMISMASGLVLGGKKVVVHTIASFLIGRAFEQLKVDFGYRGVDGLFVSVGGSFDYGRLGCTHHAPEDVALIASIPGSRIMIPGSDGEVKHLIDYHFSDPKLDYLRLSGFSHGLGTLENLAFLHRAKNPKLTLIAVGPSIGNLINLCTKLDLDLIYLNILNSELGLVDVIRTKQVLIVEPFYTGTTRYAVKSLNGGNKVVESIGVPKKFHVDYINYGERIKEIGLDSSAIEFLVQKIICRKL